MNLEGAGVPDFVLLSELSEKALMANLKVRFESGSIYTYIGEVVVSVNPYKKMDHLYSAKQVDEYRGKYLYEKPPHIYSLSNNAYRRLMQYKENQCVIISGESGAGKTEASKLMMQYIAAVSKSSNQVENVKNRLLESNPILEAFGNAKTVRNDNSSRFGKYMEIQFQYDGAPVGGKITNYLLEKSRVVIRSKGERSFHIFYQILAGLSDADLGKMKLKKDPKAYNYLNSSDCVTVDTINDASDFKVVDKALNVLGFKPADKTSMWKIVGGILQLGNLTFSGTGPQDHAVIKDQALLKDIESLWELSPGTLGRALTARSITTGVGKRGSSITIPLDTNTAAFTRDALSKGLYEKLFIWLVDTLNSSLSQKSGNAPLVIGLLDIYGFEVFENNSFEQFCINLCNEKLQQLFIELTLKSEQEEYLREGIQWEPVKYFNNEIICELIEGKPPKVIGITQLMDECGWISDSTDLTLLEKISTTFAKHPHFESYKSSNNKKIAADSFVLKHYAGDVTYRVGGFLEKNKDTFYLDLYDCLSGSSEPLLKSIFPVQKVDSKKRPLTASTQFKNALQQLMEKLLACQPHYVRCIKPNDNKKPGVFNEERVAHQVRYLGLLENVRVRRAGFAFRQTYDRFVWRYKVICKETWPGSKKPDLKAETEKIVKFLKLSPDEYRFGKTKVFLRNPTTLFRLEEERDKKIPRVVTLMQAAWRGFVARRQWGRLRAAIKIQLWYRRQRFVRWFREVNKTFANVKNDPHLGKFIQWPANPSVLALGAKLMKAMHIYWRAKVMVMSLSAPEQAEMRQKILAYNIFHKKKYWDVARRYEADYLQKDSNPNKLKYVEISKNLFAKYGDTSVMFADYINKITSKGKMQKRGVVITEKNIYKHDPKTYKIKKFETPLVQVKGIQISPQEDTYVVVLCKEPYRDLVFDLGCSGEERYAEFVTVIVQEVRKITGETIPVDFTNTVKFNTGRNPAKGGKGTDMAATFEATSDPKITGCLFKKGKAGYVVVFPPRKNVRRKTVQEVLSTDDNENPELTKSNSGYGNANK